MTGNYQLVYQWRRKYGNHRDTGVSKNLQEISLTENQSVKKCWLQKLWRDNYEEKLWHEIISDAQLWGEIMTGNYQLVYQWRRKCGNYRDTGVSKKILINNFLDLVRGC